MQRIVLGIEYDGSRYSGWQRQRDQASVQGTLEQALAKIATHEVVIHCAGRTDTGVHASGQIIHFDTAAVRADIAWVRGTNSHLPKDIRVTFAQAVPGHFDARRSALSRRYSYVILNRPHAPGLWHHGAAWISANLDADRMHQAAQHLLGAHDFSAFRAAECQALTPMRTIYDIQIKRWGETIFIEIEANAFLHHMVRNIVGTLIPIGKQQYAPEFIGVVLDSRDRRCALATAPANGLYLVKVRYPAEFLLPHHSTSPWFFASPVEKA